jgi:hypothetical protein
VTEILKVVAKPGLEAWKKEQVLLAAVESIRSTGKEIFDILSDEAKRDTWMRGVVAESETIGTLAAERGRDIHKDIDEYLTGGVVPQDPASQRACKAIEARYRISPTAKIMCHVPFVNPKEGFAGEMDMAVSDGVDIIADIKTKDMQKGFKPSIENGMQLAGYMLGAGSHDRSPVLENVFVDRATGETQFFRWPTSQSKEAPFCVPQLVEAFKACRSLWCVINRYNP